MAGYVHRDARARAEAAAASLPVERERELAEEAQGWILEHRQRIKAGVPSCTCGEEFDSYPGWETDHAMHLARQLVGPLARRLLPRRAEQSRSGELIRTA